MPTTENAAPADLLEGAELVEEIAWTTVFARICERVDQAITEIHGDMRPVICPDCRGRGHTCCRYTGKVPWKYVAADKRARLQLAIEILEHQLPQRGPEEAHWFERALKELRGLLESKYDEGVQNGKRSEGEGPGQAGQAQSALGVQDGQRA